MQISFAALRCSNLVALSCSKLAALSCSNLAAPSCSNLAAVSCSNLAALSCSNLAALCVQRVCRPSYTPLKLCLWEGILFSRCPSDRPNNRLSVTFCFLNNFKNH